MKSSAYKEYFGATCLVQLKEPIAMAVPESDKAVQEPEFNRDNELRVAASGSGIGVKSRLYYPATAERVGLVGGEEVTNYKNFIVARLYAVDASDDALALAYVQTFRGEEYLVTSIVPVDFIQAVSYIGSKKPDASRIVTPAS